MLKTGHLAFECTYVYCCKWIFNMTKRAAKLALTLNFDTTYKFLKLHAVHRCM